MANNGNPNGGSGSDECTTLLHKLTTQLETLLQEVRSDLLRWQTVNELLAQQEAKLKTQDARLIALEELVASMARRTAIE